MAFRSFALAAATGFAASYGRSYTSNGASSTAHCESTSTAVTTSSSSTEADPNVIPALKESCKCVIIGGGFAGAKAAYYLDSMVDVTLIDEKNFYEMSYAVTPVLTSKWDEKESVAEMKKISAVHRYYLKRANVVTGTANKVTENEVILADGRRVPYDLLVLATGGRKPYPFESSQRTLAGRIDEVKNFNLFLRDKCKKVAIVGGGPAGVSLAASLIEQQPEKEVVLFHSHDELLPKMPKSVRVAAEESLLRLRDATKTRKQLFSYASSEEKAAAEAAAAAGSFTLKLNHRVTDVAVSKNASTGAPFTTTIVAKPPIITDDDSSASSASAADGNNTKSGGFLGGLFGISSSSASSTRKTETFTNVPTKFRVVADELDNTGGETETARRHLLEGRSILHRLYFGDHVPSTSVYSDAVAHQLDQKRKDQLGLTENGLVDTDFPKVEMEREVKSKISCIKREGIVFDDFDYVFDLRGTIPRPIISLPSDIEARNKQIASAKNKKNSSSSSTAPADVNILDSHVLPSGKYRASLLLQLLGHPNIFAIGKCNNLPWLNSCGMSDTQVKILFSEIMAVIFSDPSAPRMLSAATDGLQPKTMTNPKLLVPFGNFEAAGFSTQQGAVSGARGILEFKADREHLLREFQQPIFFKQRDQKETKHRIQCWLNEEITDVTDFSF